MSEDIKYSCLEHGWLDLDGLCEQCLLREAKRMTADTKRPREFWIHPECNLIANEGETREWQGIHVIEKSAFDALKKDYLESSGAMNKEIAELEAELAACKASMNAHDKSRAKVLLKVAELEAERYARPRELLDKIEALEKQVAELQSKRRNYKRALEDLGQSSHEAVTMLKEERDALQAKLDQVSDDAVVHTEKLQSRLAECEKKLERTTVPDLIKIGEDLREKLAAAEAEKEQLHIRLARCLGALEYIFSSGKMTTNKTLRRIASDAFEENKA